MSGSGTRLFGNGQPRPPLSLAKRSQSDTTGTPHEIVIVASSLDDSSERIVKYLSDRGVAINVLCFQVFTHGTEQLPGCSIPSALPSAPR